MRSCHLWVAIASDKSTGSPGSQHITMARVEKWTAEADVTPHHCTNIDSKPQFIIHAVPHEEPWSTMSYAVTHIQQHVVSILPGINRGMSTSRSIVIALQPTVGYSQVFMCLWHGSAYYTKVHPNLILAVLANTILMINPTNCVRTLFDTSCVFKCPNSSWTPFTQRLCRCALRRLRSAILTSAWLCQWTIEFVCENIVFMLLRKAGVLRKVGGVLCFFLCCANSLCKHDCKVIKRLASARLTCPLWWPGRSYKQAATMLPVVKPAIKSKQILTKSA